MSNIRNFAIIAHVDHGKSTLADRFLEITGVLSKEKHVEQFLDRNPISRERGITIKLAPVRMEFKTLNSELYILNLIDTPGHVDFSYEVDRTLACVEGVILLVDATSGIQAQTVSNAYKALEKNLVVIPAVNKIDLPNAQVKETKKELAGFLGIAEDEVFEISAKNGIGVEILLQAVVEKIPPPVSKNTNSFQALIFDSYYDTHRGVIAFIRIFDGSIQKRMKIKLHAQNLPFEVSEVGVFVPDLKPVDKLGAGEIGYVVTGLKNIHTVRVGDTILNEKSKLPALSGYKEVRPMVFASLFTTDPQEYLNLKKALEKHSLNDSSLIFRPIVSRALGAGFRVGFLGLLHADVVRERIEREYGLDLVVSPPQVEYEMKNNEYLEPLAQIFILTPQTYLNVTIQLLKDYRAQFIAMDNKEHVSLTYEMPMSEMVTDFYDRLKTVTSGYASFDWEFLRYEKVDAAKLEILLNGSPVDEFSEVVVSDRAFQKAKSRVSALREVIPRQQFEVQIQAKYKGKIIASERISPVAKNVTEKLYGGDRTRKDKLLKKQKEGKKRMKMVGHVEIPKEAFLKLFKRNS